MKNHTLARIHKSIPYIPVLRAYAGSVTACLLMQQLDYWFSGKNGEPIYKFLDAQKKEKPHPAYKLGDSLSRAMVIFHYSLHVAKFIFHPRGQVYLPV